MLALFHSLSVAIFKPLSPPTSVFAFASQTRDAQLSADNPAGPTTCEHGVLGRHKELVGPEVHFNV